MFYSKTIHGYYLLLLCDLVNKTYVYLVGTYIIDLNKIIIAAWMHFFAKEMACF